jgi:nucleotide-binding universal stress UspA family protein
MKTIVVATDGSAGSARALRWAKALASPTGAEVVPVPACGAPSVLDAADRVEADLVVLAAHPWSVVDYVARHAGQPFAMVPSSAPARLPRRIAVGDDGSPGAGAADAWSAAVATATDAEIVAIEVVHPPSFLARFLPELHDDVVHDLEEHWSGPAAPAVRTDVIDDDDPAWALLDEAEAAGADVLVLGARALCGVRLLPRDGVTMTALHHARVPVVVVPAPAALLTIRDGGSEEGYTVQRVMA